MKEKKDISKIQALYSEQIEDSPGVFRFKKKTIKILLVEDNPVDVLLITKALKGGSYSDATLLVVGSLADALKLSGEDILILLLDLNLIDSDGLNTVRRIREYFPDNALIIITGLDDEEVAIETLREGAQNYLLKKLIDNKILDKTIRFSLERHLTLQKLRAADKELIFQSKEKEKRTAELIIANKELIFLNEEMEKRAIELIIANDELKEAELIHEKINAEIVQRNKDLEQFSYIVSHNLRAPVANIMGLSVAAQNENLAPDVRKEIMEGLSHSVKKLDDVIIDLNNILKVKREISDSKELVNFSSIANNIHSSIETLIEKEKVVLVWDFSEVDEILTIRSYLYSIFYNLISNSIKYRQPNIAPVIEIKSQKSKDKIVLLFKDNGLGIDLKKKGDQVFGLYKRFHSENTEGKGMGLYMVKTEVESLGGKISVESEVGKGTTFKIVFET